MSNLSYANSDRLRIPLQTASVSLDPSHVQDASSLFVSRQINCQLVRSQGSIYKLEAAKSIEYISPLEIMIKLNDNAKFYDGTPVTSNDVLASFNHIKDTRNVLRNMFLWVNEVRIVDDKTIIFKLKKPIPQFIKVLASSHNAIFKKDFLNLAKKDNSLWKNPIGCGGYKINAYNDDYINLIPIKSGMKITFFLNKTNQVAASAVDQYDLISLNIVGEDKKINDFNKLEVFDPYQIYIGLNAKRDTWKSLHDRCSFLSKIDPNNLQKVYGGSSKIANDFLPAGMLGYSQDEKYFSSMIQNYKDKKTPKLNEFCLSYLTVSVSDKYLNDYSEMIKKIYPSVKLMPISDNRQFGQTFIKQKCDGLIFALKSNNLDGYEYLDIFANNDANFSGITDKQLVDQIKNSQDIVDPYARSKEYRKLISRIENMCVIRPLITTTMRTIYLNKMLIAPDIGLGSLNDYYLGNVKRI